MKIQLNSRGGSTNGIVVGLITLTQRAEMITVEHGLGKKPAKMYLLPYEVDGTIDTYATGTLAKMISNTNPMRKRKPDYQRPFNEYGFMWWANGSEYVYNTTTKNDESYATYDDKKITFKGNANFNFLSGTYLWVAISED